MSLTFKTVRRALVAPILALFLLSVASGCGPKGGTSKTFLITFVLNAASANVASLNFTVTYIGGGQFAGTGSAVSCNVLGNAGGGSTFSDDDQSVLTLSIVSGASLLAAGDNFARCNFDASVAPTTGNFSFGTVTATDTNGSSVTATVTVIIADAATATTTTSTTTTTLATTTTTKPSTTTTTTPAGVTTTTSTSSTSTSSTSTTTTSL